MISFNQIMYGVTGSILLILMLRSLKDCNYNILLLLGAVIRSLESLINSYMLFCGELHFYQVFLLRFMATTFEILSDSLLTSSIQGRLYDIIPEGFESTGVAMTHIFHIFRVWSYQIDIFQIKHYQVRKGYYGRMRDVVRNNFAYSVLIVSLAPLLLSFK